MGRKRYGCRKHFLFLVAGLIIVLYNRCASIENLPEESAGGRVTAEEKAAGGLEGVNRSRRHLSEGQKFLRRGEYDRAFQEYQKAAVLAKKNPPADEALFSMGLILSSPGNPQKDPPRALEFMKSVFTEFPQSPFADPARIWTGLIQENDRLVKAYEKSLQDREILARDYEKLHKTQDKLTKDNEKLNKMLEDYKQVDIEMEGKRREKGR
jgi:tetratricopeptide (TPR) repeat protein